MPGTPFTLYYCGNGATIAFDPSTTLPPIYSPDSNYDSIQTPFPITVPPATTILTGSLHFNCPYIGVYTSGTSIWLYFIVIIDDVAYPSQNGYSFSIPLTPSVNIPTNTVTFTGTINQNTTNPGGFIYDCFTSGKVDNLGLILTQSVNVVINVNFGFTNGPAATTGTIVLHPQGFQHY